MERKDFLYDVTVPAQGGDCYYDGYWQHEEYFKDAEDAVRNAFSFPEWADIRNTELASRLRTGSVSLHIRRGDYINHPLFQGICDLDYYKRAIDCMNKRVNPRLYCIFSNDISWCENNLSGLLADKEVVYVDWNKGAQSHADMQLMGLCDHNVIANSSFSWWGAWLNRNPQKVVIAPRKWMNVNCEDPVPDSWIRI